VAGLDISAESLKYNGHDQAVMVASMSRLPLADGMFDAVLLLETLQHLPRPELALAEAARVLKPGGKMIIIDRNPLALNAERPWLPSLLIKAIDQRRGLWMYPANAPVRERWRLPHSWRKMVAGQCHSWHLTYAESSEEKSRTVRRLVPLARPFFCLTGTKAGILQESRAA
jgi:2-polyprenyl-6-hydroxyphenyl methylase/3-demethylubiquinone-9 3-methyltransferase